MRFILFLTTLLFLFSCEVINTEEDIPSTITIESIEVDGNHSSKITDAWIYIDNEFQGVFPLPANFPVLKTGELEIIIEAGIKKNGISSSRENYPYFTSYEINSELLENQNTSFSPTVSYLTSFPYNENFEGVGTSLNVVSDSSNHTIEKIYNNSNNNFGNYYAKSVISGEFGELLSVIHLILTSQKIKWYIWKWIINVMRKLLLEYMLTEAQKLIKTPLFILMKRKSGIRFISL